LAQHGVLRAQFLNLLPDVLHTWLLIAVARMEFADVFGKVVEFGLGKFVAASSAEESREGFLEDDVVHDVGRNFVPLEGGFIHKGEFSCSGKAEKGGQALKGFDIAWRRVDAALDFAPVARIEAGLFAEVAQGKAFFQAEFFNGVIKHILLINYFVVKDYHTCQCASMGDKMNLIERELLIVDRTAAPAGEGLLTTTTGARATLNSIRHNREDTRPIISHVAQAMLAKFGSMVKGGRGVVRSMRA